jgi:hypothetical protein
VVPFHPAAARHGRAPAAGARRALDGDEVRLEVAPDVVVRVARRAVAGRVGASPASEAEEADAAE